MQNQTKSPTQFIEIIGLAGAGKSTLANALMQKPLPILLIDQLPFYREWVNVPFFVKNTLRMLPTLSRLIISKHDGNLTLEEIAWMVTLHGWYERFQKNSVYPDFVLFDEGPIFHMAFLHFLSPTIFQSTAAAKWWSQLLEHWGRTLNTVVLLDADDQILIERIRSRKKMHSIQQRDDIDSIHLLDRYREIYRLLLQNLTAISPGVRIIQYRTDEAPVDEICNDFVQTLLTNQNRKQPSN
ncbi:MAG: hypothetical protein JW750_02395 [Anaerolineaceae bacterium]|nr:hypothetical protein [Anaerolineaceae bacterium]